MNVKRNVALNDLWHAVFMKKKNYIGICSGIIKKKLEIRYGL